MDSIDTFKLKALDSMKQTIGTLSNEVDKSQAYIARAQGATPTGAITAQHPALSLDSDIGSWRANRAITPRSCARPMPRCRFNSRAGGAAAGRSGNARPS
jgi:hypothetical protein